MLDRLDVLFVGGVRHVQVEQVLAHGTFLEQFRELGEPRLERKVSR